MGIVYVDMIKNCHNETTHSLKTTNYDQPPPVSPIYESINSIQMCCQSKYVFILIMFRNVFYKLLRINYCIVSNSKILLPSSHIWEQHMADGISHTTTSILLQFLRPPQHLSRWPLPQKMLQVKIVLPSVGRNMLTTEFGSNVFLVGPCSKTS